MPPTRYKLHARLGRRPRLSSLLAWLPGLLLCSQAAAMELPTWEQLVFEQKSFWATARGVLTLSEFTDARGARDIAAPNAPGANDTPRYLSLDVNNYVASNSEQITLTLDAESGATQFRWRLSRGRESRVKIYEYRDHAIARERREPPAEDTSVSPADWPPTHEMDVDLPPEAKGKHIVATHALLVLLPTLIADPAIADDYIVHTDLNFFRLKATLSGKTVPIDSVLTLNGERREAERLCRVLTLEMTPLPGNPEDADIMLMGMSGKIHVFIDRETGLPLRLRGDAPRIGRAELQLIEASTRTARTAAQRPEKPPAP